MRGGNTLRGQPPSVICHREWSEGSLTATTLRGDGKRRGTFPRSGPTPQRDRPGEPDRPCGAGIIGHGPARGAAAPASWRSGIGDCESRTDRDGRAVAAGQLVARSRIRMNEHPRRAVDPIVSGSPDPPGDGSIDRQGPKWSTRQADSKPRSFIDIYLSRRRSKAIEQFGDAVTWPLRDSATRRSGDPVMWRQVHMTM